MPTRRGRVRGAAKGEAKGEAKGAAKGAVKGAVKRDAKAKGGGEAGEVRRVYDAAVAEVRRRKLGVRLPSLFSKDGDYTVGGLMVVFFAARVGKIVDKTELCAFLRSMRCDTVDPQPRHLGMQCGFNFLVQGCFHPVAKRKLRRGEYCLLDMKSVHPSHATMHRVKVVGVNALSWEPLKKLYGGRCACCGSVEGQRHLKNDHLVTTLEKGHCDPRRPLTNDNCIPMCKLCNMVYKDHAVLNRRGFVVQWLRPTAATPDGGFVGDDDKKSWASSVSSSSTASEASAEASVEASVEASEASDASASEASAEDAASQTSPAQPKRQTVAGLLWAGGAFVYRAVSSLATRMGVRGKQDR